MPVLVIIRRDMATTVGARFRFVVAYVVESAVLTPTFLASVVSSADLSLSGVQPCVMLTSAVKLGWIVVYACIIAFEVGSSLPFVALV